MIDWIMKQPRRFCAFGRGGELDIALALANLSVRVFTDGENEIVGVIAFVIDEPNKCLHVKHILAKPGGLNAMLRAWHLYFPDYAVDGVRRPSGKQVQHKLSDFVKA